MFGADGDGNSNPWGEEQDFLTNLSNAVIDGRFDRAPSSDKSYKSLSNQINTAPPNGGFDQMKHLLGLMAIIESTQIGKTPTTLPFLKPQNACPADPEFRDSRGICENNTLQKLWEAGDEAIRAASRSKEDLPTNITQIEKNALNNRTQNAPDFGFYKDCYICGLKWRKPGGIDFTEDAYRKEGKDGDDSEPKQPEHVIAVGNSLQMFFFLLRVRAERGAGGFRFGDDQITHFMKLFGGVKSKYSFLYADSCALCNQVKNDILPYTYKDNEIIIEKGVLTKILNKIYLPKDPNHRKTLRGFWNKTAASDDNKYARTLTYVSWVAEQAKLVERRYLFILKFLESKISEIVERGLIPAGAFGKILIPVKGYGVQRVNISKLKKRFKKNQISLIKKHMV